MSLHSKVLFDIKQSSPQYKNLLGGNVSRQNGFIALHSESDIDLLSLCKKGFVRSETTNSLATVTNVSGGISRSVCISTYLLLNNIIILWLI